jgi:hypothetical protein
MTIRARQGRHAGISHSADGERESKSKLAALRASYGQNEEFKAWWKKALAGEKTQFNLNYGFFGFRLSEVGPKLSVAMRAELARSDVDPLGKVTSGGSLETAVNPDPSREAPDTREHEVRETIAGPEISEDMIVSEYRTLGALTKDLLRLFSERRQAVHVNVNESTSVYIYVLQRGEIVGEGYELTHPRGGARIVKARMGGADTSVFAPGFEKALVADIRAQGIDGVLSFVIAREKLPD